MPPTIIAVATHKGGAGKTVTSMAIAATLARAGHETLLGDLDPQGHSTIGLGLELEPNAPTLRDLFADPPVPVAGVLRKTHLEHLTVLPSNIRLERIARELATRPKSEALLLRSLAPILDRYRFVILDCPPSLGVLTENAITAATFILIPCQMEARAADGLLDLLDLIAFLKEGFTNWRILRTRVDVRKSTTNEAVMAALEPWAANILRTSIPQSEPLNQAQMERTDIFTFDPASKGALAYQALTEELLAYVKHK